MSPSHRAARQASPHRCDGQPRARLESDRRSTTSQSGRWIGSGGGARGRRTRLQGGGGHRVSRCVSARNRPARSPRGARGSKTRRRPRSADLCAVRVAGQSAKIDIVPSTDAPRRFTLQPAELVIACWRWHRGNNAVQKAVQAPLLQGVGERDQARTSCGWATRRGFQHVQGIGPPSVLCDMRQLRRVRAPPPQQHHHQHPTGRENRIRRARP